MKWNRTLTSIMFIAVTISSCSLLNSTAADQATLDSLRDAGSDLSKVHPFDFYIYHPDEASAMQICSQLQADGLRVSTREGAIEGEWLCLASMSFVPSIEKLSELEAKFVHLIDQYGGDYDGWETIVTP